MTDQEAYDALAIATPLTMHTAAILRLLEDGECIRIRQLLQLCPQIGLKGWELLAAMEALATADYVYEWISGYSITIRGRKALAQYEAGLGDEGW